MENVVEAFQAAKDGNAKAWQDLVDGHSGLVWSVIRGFRFDEATSKDVSQTVWLRFAENLERIREPARLASWLGQTTRNECVGVVRQRERTTVADEVAELGNPLAGMLSEFPQPGDSIESEERRRDVAQAFRRLPERCQMLLGMLVSDPPVSYGEISERLGIPVGSIGPTRARCLNSLRATPEISRIISQLRSS